MPIISIIGLVVATIVLTLMLGIAGAMMLVQLDVES